MALFIAQTGATRVRFDPTGGKTMRTAFIEQLIIQARVNPQIFLVVGDLGYSVVEPFADEFPDRFLNAGVSEQNMTGVAAGLAAEGYHVFTYSIANFPTLRCLEQIRNDVCYHNLPVTVVSVGGGVAYGNLGYSHHAVQDLAIMRSLGNIQVLSPADPGETADCVRLLVGQQGPSYLRLGKAGEASLHNHTWNGGLIQLKGSEVSMDAIVATGAVLKIAMKAADLLQERGKDVAVYSCPQVHPFEQESVTTLKRHHRILVVEEHVKTGGLFSAVLENLSPGSHVLSASLPNTALHSTGSQAFLWRESGLTDELLAARLI